MAQSTMIQMNPAAAQPVVPAKPAVQPAPAQPAVHPGEAGKGAPPKAGSAFRETLWFKQGDVEQMVADAKAKLQAGKATTDVPAVSDDGRPLEDRYVDDGSVTVEDRKKFSLRTGGTSASIPASAVPLPSEHIDEKEAERMAEKMRKADFNLEDFLAQMQQVKKMGSMQSLIGMMPGMAGIREQLDMIKTLKSQLTSIGTATKAVWAGLDTLRSGVLARVSEAELELRPSR